MKLKKRILWQICCLAVFALSIVTFTPLVMPLGEHEPGLLGVPYTLWTSILVAIGFVALTYMATQVYPPTDNRREI